MRTFNLFTNLNLSSKTFIEILILVLSTLAWYYITLNIISSTSKDLGFIETELLFISSVYHLAIISSSVMGCFISSRAIIKRFNLLYSWMFLGAVAPLLLAFFNLATFNQVATAFLFLGIIFGFGLPSSLAYFADYTPIENRGYVSGLVGLITYSSFIPIIVAVKTLNVQTNFMMSAAWRIMGFILFFLITRKKENIISTRNKQKSFSSIFRDKKFFLFLIPWLMFLFVDRAEEFLLRDFLKNTFGQGFFVFVQFTSALVVCFSAFISGVLSDVVGRKRVVTGGFVALGLSYAVISFAPANLFAWYFWIVANGTAWGTFLTMFILVLWGDLSSRGFREKYYLLGSIPFFLTSFIQLFLGPLVALVEPSSAFSLASFFLFLAVLPLMYAPETLPERKIKLRQLRSYVEAAKKVKEKYLKKTGRG
jgi:MFS family permease